MRGKLAQAWAGLKRSRLIPAHAGKTHNRQGRSSIPAAHPRACGENVSGLFFSVVGQGSSPRMRGKRGAVYNITINGGLIPAHAGKTA